MRSKPKTTWQKIWHFFWHDDSGWSWLVNILVAFLLIRFAVYPLLGIMLGTSFPIVAVVSESMEHGLHEGALCGQQLDGFKESFDNYWDTCGDWYENKGITQVEFADFKFPNGFNKGDVIVLWRANKGNLDVGDVLVFQGNRPQPIIHRIVDVEVEEGNYFYQTKGDHNNDSIGGALGEKKISENRIVGQGILRIPYMGWLKILFVDALRLVGINLVR